MRWFADISGSQGSGGRFPEPWESVSIEPGRIEDLGDDRVLALITFYGTGKDSGVEVTLKMANIYTFRDGWWAGQVGYGDWPSALRTAGLADK